MNHVVERIPIEIQGVGMGPGERRVLNRGFGSTSRVL